MALIKSLVRRSLRLLDIDVRRANGGLLLTRGMPNSANDASELFPGKFGAAEVERAITLVAARWPDRKIVLLVDRDIALPAKTQPMVDCRTTAPAHLGGHDPSRTVFVYACDSDSIGAPFVREVIARKGVFFPVKVYQPSSYANVSDDAMKVVAAEFARQTDAGFCKFDFGAGDSLNLAQAIAITSGLKGDYLEIGCFRGSSACVALAYMRQIGLRRTCYFLDVFEGFNYPAAKESSDALWADTHATEGLETIRARITACGDPESGLVANVIRNNVITDELPDKIADLALANIDVDLYEAVQSAIFKVAPKLVIGGIMVVEDPGHTPALIGSRVALEDFLASPAGASFMPIYMESGQTYLIRMR